MKFLGGDASTRCQTLSTVNDELTIARAFPRRADDTWSVLKELTNIAAWLKQAVHLIQRRI